MEFDFGERISGLDCVVPNLNDNESKSEVAMLINNIAKIENLKLPFFSFK